MTILIGLLGAVLGATIGAITTYFTTRSTMRLSLEQDYDKALRDIRLKGYQQLFHLTAQIPRHWLLTPEPSRAELMKIRISFHDWYYSADALRDLTRRRYQAVHPAGLETLAQGKPPPPGAEQQHASPTRVRHRRSEPTAYPLGLAGADRSVA